MNNIQAIILAAGKGTRMNQGRPSSIPKALIPLAGKPMVSYILKTLGKMAAKKPILVVGYKAEMIKKIFGDTCWYVVQKKRLGTGHAARLAIEYIAKNSKSQILNSKQNNNLGFSALHLGFENENLVLILHADDSAFYKRETLQKFIRNHQQQKATLSFLVTQRPDLNDFGRIIRDKSGRIIQIVEKDDLTPEQRKIGEINCGCYLIDTAWAKTNLKKLKKTCKGGREYPLTDIIKIALKQNKKVTAYAINAREWLGINSPEQLAEAEKQLLD